MNPLTRDHILNELQKKREFLQRQFYVERIALFGSFAENRATATSDIDFLVEFDAPLKSYIANRYRLADYLRSLFGRDVDLANPKSLRPYCREHILKQAVYV